MYPIYTQRLQPVRVFKSVDRSSISTPTGLLEFQQLKPIRQLIPLLSYPILLPSMCGHFAVREIKKIPQALDFIGLAGF